MACTLDSCVELSLVLCACAGNSSGKDLTALAYELSQLCVLVVDIINLVCAENANFLSLSVGTESACCVLCSIHFDFPPINSVYCLRRADRRPS